MRAAATGGAISSGINRLTALGNFAGKAAVGAESSNEAASMVGDYAKNYGTASEATTPSNPASVAKPADQASKPASNPSLTPSTATPEQAASQGKEVATGIYEHGRGQYSDKAGGMGFSGGFTGQPNAQNQRAAQALADGQSPVGMSVQEAQSKGLIGERVGYNPAYDQRLNPSTQGDAATNPAGTTGAKPKESWGDFTNRMIAMERGQPSGRSTGAVPQMARPTAVHSGNDWNVRQRLRSLGIAASSIAGTARERANAQSTYQQAQLSDLAAMTGQSGLDVQAMQANAGLQQEGMTQEGANMQRLRDIGASFAGGAIGASKAIADAAGADNAVSAGFGRMQETVQGWQSPERQAERARRAASIKEAESSGSLWREVGANLGGVIEAPISTMAEAAGSVAPVVATMLATRGRAGTQAVAAGLGVAQGAGAVKGSIHEAVKNEHLQAGATQEAASAAAD